MSRNGRSREGARRVLAVTCVVVVLLVAVAALSDTPTPPLVHPYPNQLPEGEGSVLAARACVCRAATLITHNKQGRPPDGRDDGGGAPLTAEQDTVVR